MDRLKIALAGLLFFSLSAAYAAAPQGNGPKGTPVTAVKAVLADMTEVTNVQGQIESLNAPRISAKVAAEVVSVNVEEGTHVETGQLLAELDDQSFKIAEENADSAIQRLQALIANQQKELNRREDLAAKNVTSQSALDEARTALKLSQAELVGAKARLKEARYQLSHTKIVSPTSGTIQQRAISKGDYVSMGTLLFQIANTEDLRARLFFPETMSSTVRTGMTVRIKKDGETTEGKIGNLRPMLEPGSRALHALVDLKNEHDWKPGASITALVKLAERPQSVVIPAKALVRRPAGLVVYLLNGDTVTEQTVETGIKQGELIEVRSGVKAGDTVVQDGAYWLTDKAKVAVQGDSK